MGIPLLYPWANRLAEFGVLRGRWKIDHPGSGLAAARARSARPPDPRADEWDPGLERRGPRGGSRSRAPARELCVRRRLRAGGRTRFARGDDRRGASRRRALYKHRRGPHGRRPRRRPSAFTPARGFPTCRGREGGSRSRYASTCWSTAGAADGRARAGADRGRPAWRADLRRRIHIRPGRAIRAGRRRA